LTYVCSGVSVPLTPSSGWEEDLRGMKGARE
jgi:hypothetical protein